VKKPSVTQLTDLLSKPALIGWANRLGLQGIDIKEKRRASLAKGSSLHGQIERVSLGTGDFDDERNRERFAALMADKTIISVEKKIETEWFVGRYDSMIRDSAGQCWIVDYKSGFKGKIYLENKLQLIAYTMSEPADMAVISIPGFQFYPFEAADRKPYEQMLIKLSEIYQLKKEIEHE